MRYLFAIFLPPVAVIMCGKPFQFLLNIVLSCIYWIPGMIHALLVVSAWERKEKLEQHQQHMRELALIAGARGK